VYAFELTADDGALSTKDTVTIRVFEKVISTLDHDGDGISSGNGADTWGQNGGAYLNNYGANSGVQVRYSGGAGTSRKGLLRFDLSDLDQNVTAAQLDLDISTTNTGLIAAWTYNVFGLKDGDPDENWGEGDNDGTTADSGEVYYDIIPGTTFQSRGGAYDSTKTNSAGVVVNDVIFLGTFTLREGIQETVSFTSEKLTQFINDDTDDNVSIILTRVDNSSNTVVFAAKEDTNYAPPSLRVVLDTTPIINLPPNVTVGDDQQLQWPVDSTQLSALVTDDGEGNGPLVYTWSQLSGEAVSFSTGDTSVTDVSFTHPGVYDLVLTVSDGELSTSDTLRVTIFETAITTADGNGADTYGQSNSAYLNNYGGSTGIVVRFSGTGTARKGLIRFDLSDLDKDVAEAQLELDISTTNTGLIEAWTYNVFGLKDGDPGENWGEGDNDGTTADSGEVYYDIIPGTTFQSKGGAFDPNSTNSAGVVVSKVDFLGTFTLRVGVQETITFSSQALADFLNADSDSLVSIILTRVDNSVNSISFASKEDGTYAAPTLRIVPTQTCENTSGLAGCDDDSDGITNDLDLYPNDSLNNNLGAVVGYAWDDLNGNSLQDSVEPPIVGMKVYLTPLSSSTTVLDSTYTNANGLAAFFDIPLNADRRLVFDKDSLYDFVKHRVGSGASPTIDSDVVGTGTPATRTNDFAFSQAGQVQFDTDGGFRSPGTIIARVWVDANDNGLQDSAEVSLSGVSVDLVDDNDSVLITQTSDASGEVTFGPLLSGRDYRMVPTKPAGYAFADFHAGSDATLDSDIAKNGGNANKTQSIGLTLGAQVITSYDIGLVPDSMARLGQPAVVLSEPTIKLYPNPARTALFVEVAGMEVDHYELYDRLGRRLQAFTQAKLSVSSLAEGMYLIRVVGTNGDVHTRSFLRRD
jgi:hypothetical protein